MELKQKMMTSSFICICVLIVPFMELKRDASCRIRNPTLVLIVPFMELKRITNGWTSYPTHVLIVPFMELKHNQVSCCRTRQPS